MGPPGRTAKSHGSKALAAARRFCPGVHDELMAQRDFVRQFDVQSRVWCSGAPKRLDPKAITADADKGQAPPHRPAGGSTLSPMFRPALQKSRSARDC